MKFMTLLDTHTGFSLIHISPLFLTAIYDANFLTILSNVNIWTFLCKIYKLNIIVKDYLHITWDTTEAQTR